MGATDKPASDRSTPLLDTETRRAFEESLRTRLSEIFLANPWLVTAEIEQGAVRLAGELRSAGAASVLAVGARPGVGEVDPTIPLISMNLPDEETMVGNIHTAQRAMVEPAAEIQARVDAWDPENKAKSMGGLTANTGDLFNRPVFGARPLEWLELEDKLAIEELWAAAGIPVAKSAQVSVADDDALLETHKRLATELGTVWAGDNTMGWHGGAQGTFWVPDANAATNMAERMASYKDVRIMPFLEGIPCSIHGMVLHTEPDRSDDPMTVAVFRPCEMMMLRNPVARELFYGRVSSYWDPAPADRLAMQDVARKIGMELRRAVAYRGTFTVDGIMTADGFRPTEVNTRYGAALSSKMATISGEPLQLFQIHMALIEGLLDDVDLQPLERWATANLDASRRFLGFISTDRGPDTERTAEIRRGPSGALNVVDITDSGGRATSGRSAASSHDAGDGNDGLSEPLLLAEVRWGSAPTGGLVIVEARDGIPVGPPTAPLLVEIANVLTSIWDLDPPPLVAARQVR